MMTATNQTPTIYPTVSAAANARDWAAVIGSVCGNTSHCDWRDLFGATLVAKYGPIGLNADCRQADGTPDATRLNDQSVRTMERAEARAIELATRCDRTERLASESSQAFRLDMLRLDYRAAKTVKGRGENIEDRKASAIATAAWLTDAAKREQVIAAFQAL